MNIGDAEGGVEVAPGTFFLGWAAIEERNQRSIECPACGGYARSMECTPEEIRSDLNCGSSWACCCAAFICNFCGKRWVGHRPAPEMG